MKKILLVIIILFVLCGCTEKGVYGTWVGKYGDSDVELYISEDDFVLFMAGNEMASLIVNEVTDDYIDTNLNKFNYSIEDNKLIIKVIGMDLVLERKN